MTLQVTRPVTRRFTIDEYHRLAQAGILRADERLELIDGEVIEMTPIGERHAEGVVRITDLFAATEKIRRSAHLSVQNPIRLGDHVEPQPDLMLIRRRGGRYTLGRPAPVDILLLIEVADTTFAYDRQIKAPLYARGGLTELWIVDLVGEAVEVYRDPAPGGYQTVRVAHRGEAIAPLAFPDTSIAVADILG